MVRLRGEIHRQESRSEFPWAMHGTTAFYGSVQKDPLFILMLIY